MRPIDADKLKENVESLFCKKCKEHGSTFCTDCAINYLIHNSDKLPTLTPDDLRPKGHYITNDDGDSCCSECGENYLDITQYYCPNCGAKMGGGE